MSIESLAALIAAGHPSGISRDTFSEQTKQAIEGIFGTRYHVRSR